MTKQIDLQTIKAKLQTIHDMNKGAKHYVINMTSVELAITILLLGELEVFLAREQDELENDAQPEPCVDAISREDALLAVRMGMLSTATVYGRSEKGMSARRDIEMALKALPPVKPEQRRGKWEYVQYDGNPNIGNWHCSECRLIVNVPWKERWSKKPEYNYCPNCGAKMEGDA